MCKDIEMPHWYIVKKKDWGGGLALLWKEGVDVQVINSTDNHILVKVVEVNDSKWFLTGFYGWPKASKKPKSWALLNHIKSFINGP